MLKIFNRWKSPQKAAAAQSPSAMGRVMNSARRMMGNLSYKVHIERANIWRSQYNPLRGLTIARVVSHLEAGERGAYAELQWLYRYIERRDAVLGALVDRRLSAIEKLDWDIKVREEIPDGMEARAEEQRKALKSAYNKIGNLSTAFGHLAQASFRGFTHLEKVKGPDGRIHKLECLHQWFWVRDGVDGEWRFNPQSTFGRIDGEEVDPMRLIIREVDRPINEVAVICFVRKSLSQKDWDAFVEVYGVPAIFLILPPELSADQAEEFQGVAEDIVGNARGILPGNSEVQTVDNGARGVNPFRDHLKYQDEMLVLRGTGGKLTMLNDATGMGGGQADVQERAFEELAQAEAKKISQLLRESLDADLLIQEGFGDEEVLVYFELAANEETDPVEFVKGVKDLTDAGYKVDPAQIEEKTGYKLVNGEVVNGQESLANGKETIKNREAEPEVIDEDAFGELALKALLAARAADMQPLYKRLAEALQNEDDAGLLKALEDASAALPEAIKHSDLQAAVMGQVMAGAFVEGLAAGNEEEPTD